jgi:hypothetical protein
MLTVLLLSTVLALGAILVSAYVLTRREQRRSISPSPMPRRSALPLVASVVLMALLIWCLLHPVCLPLSDAGGA